MVDIPNMGKLWLKIADEIANVVARFSTVDCVRCHLQPLNGVSGTFEVDGRHRIFVVWRCFAPGIGHREEGRVVTFLTDQTQQIQL